MSPADVVWQVAASAAVTVFERANRDDGYRNWLSVMSRCDNAPYETAAEHESPDAYRYDRYRDGF